jgi:hypothetical protein
MKSYSADINVNDTVTQESVTVGPCGAPDSREPYVVEPAQTKRAHIKSLIAKAATDNRVTYEAVMSRTRTREVVDARFDAIAAVVSAYPDMSFPRVGKIFGRDHSSVMHALMKRGFKPRSRHIEQYAKFAAAMQWKVVGTTPTEGEATNENT